MTKIILITGVSTGLGRAMAEAALKRGHTVVGTVRKEADRAAFEGLATGRAHGRILELTDTAAIAPLVQAVEGEVGPVDVVINNAGYGLLGTIEELALDDVRRQFEVNVFSHLAVIQAVLPGMRARRAGHVINVASMGGVVTFPNTGAYHGTKFAILGLTDALAKEVAPLGIRVTSVMPGLFDTDWPGRSLAKTENRIAAYAWIGAGEPPAMTGHPAALAEAVMQVIDHDDPPLRFLVGPTAIQMVRDKLREQLAEIDRWAELSKVDGEG
ncbi:MAG: SDR family NAD(P)-dependent oxidoreductase [Myxococcales bacterium]|nr:SDR family NAD(P)-dependent oxidoreductase [Myxococcales bacterium]